MSMHITRTHRGRTRTIQKQVLLWRKRTKQYNTLKDSIVQTVLDAHAGDMDAALAWLNSPHPSLQGKRPKDLFNPTNIRTLSRFVRKHLLTVD